TSIRHPHATGSEVIATGPALCAMERDRVEAALRIAHHLHGRTTRHHGNSVVVGAWSLAEVESDGDDHFTYNCIADFHLAGSVRIRGRSFARWARIAGAFGCEPITVHPARILAVLHRVEAVL